jgi:hypothetical protein
VVEAFRLLREILVLHHWLVRGGKSGYWKLGLKIEADQSYIMGHHTGIGMLCQSPRYFEYPMNSRVASTLRLTALGGLARAVCPECTSDR